MPAPKIHDMLTVEASNEHGQVSRRSLRRDQYVLELVAKGVTIVVACRCAAIDKATFYRWREQGKNAKSGKYRDFYDALQIADAKAEASCVLQQRILARTSPAANMDFMKRRWPDRWGDKKTINQTISGPEGASVPVALQLAQLSPEQLAALAGDDEGEE